ncbi:MAG: nucleotidyl transferase AbiEii/AbiGii toxin family protein [Pseudomonadales bacterium]
MPKQIRDIGASVRSRLQKLSRETGQSFDLLLTRYTLERLLYRLSVSAYADRFVLKGAMLLFSWFRDPHRATRDLDLLGFGDASADAMVTAFKEVLAKDVEDGVQFDVGVVRIETIREDDEYGGFRLRTTASIGGARIAVTVDIAFGDALEPGAEVIKYPCMLNLPAPSLRGYARETMIAEKFQAMVALGRVNSRMKDFYDVWLLSRSFLFDDDRLARAIAVSKYQIPITSLSDWEKRAGPKSADQWVDGRSAKEAARAWLAGDGVCLPPEVQALLAGHPDFGSVSTWTAEPEVKLRFDEFPGETRNSDIVVHAIDGQGPYLIAVEAKADEPFSETVADTLATALERVLKSDRSNGIVRVQQLAQKLLGPGQRGDPPLKAIRYQLLTACAGALCEAERHGYSRALMLVHEFITSRTRDEKHRQNAEDLDRFVRRLSHGEVEMVGDGEIRGPFRLPTYSSVEGQVQLYIGKVTRNLRA